MVHPHCSNFKYFPSCLCVVKILRTRKFYTARFITRLALCHPIRVISSDSRCDLSGSSCYPTRIEMQLVLYPNSKTFTIIQNDLRLLKMNSGHSKTVFTLLAQ